MTDLDVPLGRYKLPPISSTFRYVGWAGFFIPILQGVRFSIGSSDGTSRTATIYDGIDIDGII